MSDLINPNVPTVSSLSDLLGTVVAVQANFYQVRLDHSLNTYLLCTRRAILKKIGQKVMVGDRVIIEEPDYQDGRGAIGRVLPRKTELSRPPVANADQILLVFALASPPLEPWQLSRFLVKAESTTLEIALCFNKLDLISPRERQEWQERLKKWGYNPSFISAMTCEGLEGLIDCLRGKITILAGPSGVGKSSLINMLIPQVQQRVAKVSGKLKKGRHTTRHVELFELPQGGFIADTPGFNQPDLSCSPNELAYYFPEARQQLEKGYCQFNDCLHRGEPNCLVGDNWERYEHYLTLLEEAIIQQETQQQIGEQESTMKLKVKASGQESYEPKLESKKYRRPSRRGKNQSLRELYPHQTLEDFEKEEE